MTDAKLEVKVGTISFNGEGEETWLAGQLDKFLAKLPELVETDAAVEAKSPAGNGSVESGKPGDSKGNTPAGSKTGISLAAFLKDKNATANQVRKFLATSLWLEDESGMERVSTSDVTKALSDNKQGKLGNAAQCLISNVKPGYVVKDGKKFYVTDEGREEINK